MSNTKKIINLENDTRFIGQSLSKIDSKINSKEAEIMVKEGQATMNDLSNLEEKFELKIKGIEDRISAKIDLTNSEISGKISSLPLEMKNMLLEERENQRKQREETKRFLIGTLLLGGLGLIVSVISIFL